MILKAVALAAILGAAIPGATDALAGHRGEAEARQKGRVWIIAPAPASHCSRTKC